MKLRLGYKPYVQVYLNEKEQKATICRDLTDNFNGEIFEMTIVGMKVLKELQNPVIEEDLIVNLSGNNPMIKKEIEEILIFLKQSNYIENIKENIIYNKVYENYSRIIPLWTEFETPVLDRFQIQSLINEKTIGIIGTGTIGYGLVGKLVANGVRKFILIDPDVVERTNLTRQPLFSLNDIGEYKVNVVKEFIQSRIENPQISISSASLSSKSDFNYFQNADLIVNCSDDKKINNLLQEFGYENSKAISFGGGYKGFTGRINPLVIPGKTKCYQCGENNLLNNSLNLGVSLNDRYRVSTNSSMSDFVTSILSFEILKFLMGSEKVNIYNKFIMVNFNDYSMTNFNITSQKDCIFCS